MVLLQKKKREKEYMLQLIAECMFCNFITKALFYAKYFDIFVTTVCFLLNYWYDCAAKPVKSVTFLSRRRRRRNKSPRTFQFKRIISQMCSHFYLWLIVYLSIKGVIVSQWCLGFFFLKHQGRGGRSGRSKLGSRAVIDH